MEVCFCGRGRGDTFFAGPLFQDRLRRLRRLRRNDFWATIWVLEAIKIARETWDDAFQDLIFWSTPVDFLVNTQTPYVTSKAWKMHLKTLEKYVF